MSISKSVILEESCTSTSPRAIIWCMMMRKRRVAPTIKSITALAHPSHIQILTLNPHSCMQTVVIDCRGHMLGRLASVIAKQLLSGQHIVCVRCEAITISGGMVRQKAKFERFLNKRSITNRRRGAVKFRAPSRILWRTIRGMVPHKTPRGAAALERLKVFEGVPAPYDKVKRLVIPDALKVLRLQHGHRFCKLGDMAAQVGWKHAEAVEMLEEKRKTKSAAYYEAKKKLKALRAKAEATVA